MYAKAKNVKTSTRIASSVGLSVCVSLGLFYFMSQLISGGQNLKKSDDTENFIEFVRVKRSSDTEVKKRELPKKPEPQRNEVVKQNFNVAKTDVTPNRPQMNFDTPKLDIPLATGPGGIGVNGGGGSGIGSGGGTSGIMPLVRVTPQYPRSAQMRGLEGEVHLKFDIMKDGSTGNVTILSAKPRGVFEAAAKKAVLKWKYRPQVVDGKPAIVKGEQVILPFKLEN